MLISLLIAPAIFNSCKKEEDNPAPVTGNGTLSVEFDHRFGATTLVFGQDYVDGNGDSIKINSLKYFVSNFKLIKADGSSYTIPKDECYFLINHDVDSTTNIELENVPAGDYTQLQFIVGVDSAKSRADISQRTGALDPTGEANGMYWTWNSGYIFLKVEGTSPKAPVMTMTGSRDFMYHIGFYGYKGDVTGDTVPALNNLKAITLSNSAYKISVRDKKEIEAHLKVDVAKVFSSAAYKINVATEPMLMFDAQTLKVSNNYKDMFTLDHVHEN